MTYLNVWRSGTFPEKQQVSDTTDRKHGLSAWHQTVLATFLGFRKPLYSCTEVHVMCHSSTRPGTFTVRHCTWPSFTGPSPVLVLQATNAGARRPGYKSYHFITCQWSMFVPQQDFFHCEGSCEENFSWKPYTWLCMLNACSFPF